MSPQSPRSNDRNSGRISQVASNSARHNGISSIHCCVGICRIQIAPKIRKAASFFDFLEDNVLEDGTIVPAMTGHEEGLIDTGRGGR